MLTFSGYLLFYLATIIITVATLIIIYFKWSFNFWKKYGLYTPEPAILFGNVKDIITQKTTNGERFLQFYKEFKSKHLRHAGIYLSAIPCYVPIDLEIVKNILQNDFDHFINHGTYINEEADPLSGHLFNLEDQKWRDMRVKLTPTFTSGKMKMMFHTMTDCAKELNNIINESATNQAPVNIKKILRRFTTDIIGSCAFGLDCNCLKDPTTPFHIYGNKIVENTKWEAFKIGLQISLPHSVLKFFNVKLTKPEVEEFFMKIVQDTVDYREKNNIYRKDFMHLMLQLKNLGKLSDDKKILNDSTDNSAAPGLTMNELAAQCFVFFGAGFETSSTTMTFALFELTQNLEVQEKLRKEINEVLGKHDGKLTYDACMEMTYLDKVINETLRKHPPVNSIIRKCNKDYNVPDSTICIKKGVTVMIPTIGIHYDPDYYPEPKKFDPERFNEENKRNRSTFAWLPFGAGPRICIGLRFGVLQAKVGLITILKNYKITLNERTKVPLELEKTSFITDTRDRVWLDCEKINNL